MNANSIDSQRVYVNPDSTRRPVPKPTLTLPDRTKRVKDAKSEAQKEIEEYRDQKEQEFKDFEKQVSGI